MMDGSTPLWEARSEPDMVNALEVLYEMAAGYVISELREEYPDQYEKLMSRARFKNQLVNNVRYSIDVMLNELMDEYGLGKLEEEG